jgi:hypothetical protein
MSLRRASPPLLLLLLVCACGEPEDGGSATLSAGTNVTNVTGASEASDTSTATATATPTTSGASDSDGTAPTGTGVDSSTGAGGTTGVKLDLGSQSDFGSQGGEGCTKIDFLFVIDNSNSMANEQALLIDAFPGFVAAIEDGLPQATDFHVGVTKTDVFGFDDDPAPDPQNPCPYQLGGLLATSTPPGQKSGTGPACDFASGAQYMTGGPTLAAEFSCAAQVGIKGNTGEYQAGATLAALSAAQAEPGACNDGFLRDDALLIVTVITDEDDDWSEPDAPGMNAAAWFDGVVAAKAGIETNVVFLLISGGSPKWPGCGPLDLGNNTGADDSPELTAWAQLFTNHELGDVCQAGYGETLATALATIDTACDGFTPPG